MDQLNGRKIDQKKVNWFLLNLVFAEWLKLLNKSIFLPVPRISSHPRIRYVKSFNFYLFLISVESNLVQEIVKFGKHPKIC